MPRNMWHGVVKALCNAAAARPPRLGVIELFFYDFEVFRSALLEAYTTIFCPN